MALSSVVVAAATLIGILDSSAGLKLSTNVPVATLGLKSVHNVSAEKAPDLQAGSLVYDFGFYNGADSRSYLSAGMKVVAIEADPTLVAKARADAQMLAWMNSGQLKLVNTAIAPAGAAGAVLPTKFYMNKCTQEWNSFYSSIGCRSCTAPHVEVAATLRAAACTEVKVEANTCAKILQQYGVPSYFKLDIEGAESGCYQALNALPDMVRPTYISGEVGDVSIVETLHGLGYKSFKLVQQQSGVTGAWGRGAKDCRTGGLWRSYLGAKAELHTMLSKPAIAGDVCPGSLVGGVWYDMHASRSKPEAW